MDCPATGERKFVPELPVPKVPPGRTRYSSTSPLNWWVTFAVTLIVRPVKVEGKPPADIVEDAPVALLSGILNELLFEYVPPFDPGLTDALSCVELP